MAKFIFLMCYTIFMRCGVQQNKITAQKQTLKWHVDSYFNEYGF